MAFVQGCTRFLFVMSGLLCMTGTAVAQTLYTFPGATFTPVYAFMNSATRTLDITMYELVDTAAQQNLTALAQRGVKVRVILDQKLEKANNQATFTYLNGHGVRCVWANPQYAATHQKTITADGKRALILSANLTSRYYVSSRDFAYLDTNSRHVAEIERVFNADFASATVTPAAAGALIWSPNLSRSALLAIINGARHTLVVENEEMADPNITSALANRARSGVAVTVVMTNSRNVYAAAFDQLSAAGAKVYTYAWNAPLYIHAKVILADVGTSAQRGYLGSINFSAASETKNRELGTTLATTSVLQALATTLGADAKGGTLWVPTSKLTPQQRRERESFTAAPPARDPS